MKYLTISFSLLKATAVGWNRDRGPMLAAALAYYTIFSLAPLLVISLAVAGMVFGEAAVAGQLVAQTELIVGRDIALTIESIIQNAARLQSSSILATVLGSLLLFMGASGVFNQLKTTLNMIWGISIKPNGRSIPNIIKARFLSFSMVVGIGFLLLTSVALSVGLTALRRYMLSVSPALVQNLPRQDITLGLLLLPLLFAIIFRVLPDAELAWRDVWLGAVVTGLLFMLGEFLIGQYLTHGSIGSAFGAAGSVVVILAWIYYSALIFTFGAEFTKVYANRYGSKIRPAENAQLFVRSPVRQIEPIPAPQDAVAVPSSLPSRQPELPWALPLAAGLLGLASGLLLSYLTGIFRRD